MIMADTAAAELPVPFVAFKKRGAKSKGNIRKRPASVEPEEKDESSSGEYSSSEDSTGQRVKRRKTAKLSGVSASSTNAQKTVPASDDDEKDSALFASTFKADRDVPIASSASNEATKQSNWYDEGRTADEKRSGRTASKGTGRDGTYKGLANQTSFIEKKPDAPSRSVGPVKAPTNVRTTTFTDYAPDVCKDYKQTGFCGFGDNCKFLHDRSDYKQGWQLDKEWENVMKGTKGKKPGGTVVSSVGGRRMADGQAEEEDDDDEAALDNIPFACFICKGPYREPVVTRCGHYFCQPCALTRYRKDPSCAACGAGTNGVFNTAKRLKKLLERKRERAAKLRQARIDAGEEVSDDDEEQEE